jgi:hypothetical protein
MRFLVPISYLAALSLISACGYFDHSMSDDCAKDWTKCDASVIEGICVGGGGTVVDGGTDIDCLGLCENGSTYSWCNGDAGNIAGSPDSDFGGNPNAGAGANDTTGAIGTGAGGSSGSDQQNPVTGDSGGTSGSAGDSGTAAGTGGCASDHECGKEVCDPISRSCVPCLQDRPCSGEKPYCKTRDNPDDNACITCSDADMFACPDTKFCHVVDKKDPSKNLCVNCQKDADCKNAEKKICNTNEANPSLNICIVCRSDGEPSGCPAGQICKPGTQAEANECVQCTEHKHCIGTKPICGTDHKCRACETHTECDPPFSGGVCNTYPNDPSPGACLAENAVIYVSPCAGTGKGTITNPYCNLSSAISEANTSTTKKAVLLDKGLYPVVTIENKAVWLVGKSGAVIGKPTSGQPNIYISGSSKVTLENLTVSGASGVGIQCVATTTTSTPKLTVRDCTINNNPGGGVYLNSCAFELNNDMIVRNGTTNSSDIGGVRIIIPGTVEPRTFRNNTVADNVAKSSVVAGVRCDDQMPVINSIIYGNNYNSGDQLSSPSCQPYNCLVGRDNGGTGNGNIIGKDPLFVNVTATPPDYHINAGSPCIDQADPGSAPDRDIDGQKRTMGNGPDIGADEAK